MIPSNTPAVVSYIGDGNSNEFAVVFPIWEESDLLVQVLSSVDSSVVATLVLNTDFTLAEVGRPNVNAKVTLISDGQEWVDGGGNLAAGYTIWLYYTRIAQQPARLNDLGKRAPTIFERALDRAVMTIKALEHIASRAILLAEGAAAGSGNLPSLNGNGGKFLKAKVDETGLEFGEGNLPDGGAEGAVLTKASAANQDAVWDDLVLSGYSSRFNTSVEVNGLREALEYIFAFAYLPPQVSLAGSSNILREKGTVVSAVTLTANVTKRSDAIARIRFYQGVNLLVDLDPPSNIGSGATTFEYQNGFSDNISFTAVVTDDGTSGGPTDVTSNTLTYSFVYPYYYGCDDKGASASEVAALTKNIIASTANVNREFTSGAGEVYYFAYPASYGALTSILDENGFEVIGSWTLRTENITGLDGNPVSYNIYEFNNPVTAGTTNFTFKR